jgi:hypothetical protein
MTARQSTLLRWTEAAEAAEICAYVELEREPQPAAVRRVEGVGALAAGGRRGLWPLFVERFAGLGLKGNARRRSAKKGVS